MDGTGNFLAETTLVPTGRPDPAPVAGRANGGARPQRRSGSASSGGPPGLPIHWAVAVPTLLRPGFGGDGRARWGTRSLCWQLCARCRPGPSWETVTSARLSRDAPSHEQVRVETEHTGHGRSSRGRCGPGQARGQAGQRLVQTRAGLQKGGDSSLPRFSFATSLRTHTRQKRRCLNRPGKTGDGAVGRWRGQTGVSCPKRPHGSTQSSFWKPRSPNAHGAQPACGGRGAGSHGRRHRHVGDLTEEKAIIGSHVSRHERGLSIHNGGQATRCFRAAPTVPRTRSPHNRLQCPRAPRTVEAGGAAVP